jgi:hypothetical protein
MSAKRRDSGTDRTSEDTEMDEIREFLEADAVEVKADPTFKKELRDKLWEVVESKARHAKTRGSHR